MKNGIFLGIAAAAVGGGAYMGYTYYSNASANSISGDSAKTVSVGGSRRRKKRGQNKNKKSKRS